MSTVVKFRSSIKELVAECVCGISSLKKLSKMEVDFFASIEILYNGLIMCDIDELIDQEEVKTEFHPDIKGYHFIYQKNSFILIPVQYYIGFTQAQLISSTEESLKSLGIEHKIYETDQGVQVRVKI